MPRGPEHARPCSMAKHRKQDLGEDEKDHDEFQELSPEMGSMIRDRTVNGLDHFQFALDATLPFFEVEAGGEQAVDAGEVLIADQFEHVAGALEQAVGLDLQLAQVSQGTGVTPPERQRGTDK